MRRVGVYCHEIALAAGRGPVYSIDLAISAQLHDIGKLETPTEILLAPRQLTAEERRTMELHTVFGERLLAGVPDLWLAREVAGMHHERFDGTGYPRGLFGSSISLSARITAVADAYDAIRSERPYKPAESHEHACELIAQGSGTQFDPSVVSVFMRIEADIEYLAQSSTALTDRLTAILTSDHGQGRGTCRLPILAELSKSRESRDQIGRRIADNGWGAPGNGRALVLSRAL
jgi:HD-GYP domain-containing protein (c-di-GMP phosphodiesterase class II)